VDLGEREKGRRGEGEKGRVKKTYTEEIRRSTESHRVCTRKYFARF